MVFNLGALLMVECLKALNEQDFFIVFDIKEVKINACFEHVSDAISHLQRYGVPERHRLIRPEQFAPFSVEGIKEIKIQEAIAFFT